VPVDNGFANDLRVVVDEQRGDRRRGAVHAW
jgi:hypothetical protein